MVAPIIKAIFNLGKKELNQNEKLLKNIERYEEKKTKQQESKVYGQKPVKQAKSTRNKKVRMYNSQ